VARLDSGVSARDALQCAYMLAVPRYVLRQAGEDHPDVQGRLGCTILVMARSQPPSVKSGTLQSDLDIPGERDRRFGPPPPKGAGGDDGDDDDDEGIATPMLSVCPSVCLYS